MMEEWRVVPGYDGAYEVSNYGRVRSMTRFVMRGSKLIVIPGVTLTQDVLHNGYLRVALWKCGRRRWVRTSRLVLEVFVGPSAEGYQAAHEPDPDRSNCKLSNLKWRTQYQNLAEMNDRRGRVMHAMDYINEAADTVVELEA